MDILNIAKAPALVLSVTLFAACSSGPPPKQELALTHASIRSAEAAGAASHAPKPPQARPRQQGTKEHAIKQLVLPPSQSQSNN